MTGELTGRGRTGEPVEDAHLGRVVVGAEELQQRVAELGKEITADYAGPPPLLVGVLKGAFVFMSDLARAIDLPVEFDFMAVSSYGSATRTSGVVRIVKDLEIDLTGRHVLIVEDIVDSGLTLAYLRKNLAARGPASLEVCALLVKEGLQRTDLDLRYVGFQDPARLRRRLRPRRRRAVPQPARGLRVHGPAASLRLTPPVRSTLGAAFPSGVARDKLPAAASSSGSPSRCRAAFVASGSSSTASPAQDALTLDRTSAGSARARSRRDAPRQGPRGRTATLTDGTKYRSVPRRLHGDSHQEDRRGQGREFDVDSQKDEPVAHASCSGSLPFILLFGFVLFFLSQVQGGGNRVMSFGKSRAKA